jgi:hypothetical protein
MSKPLLNDPRALFPNKAFVQGAPFDAGSLGLLALVPDAQVRQAAHISTNFKRKINSFFDIFD